MDTRDLKSNKSKNSYFFSPETEILQNISLPLLFHLAVKHVSMNKMRK